jgi:anti-sigma regulatory factor (Ser/Thr protein kinase)
MEFRHEALLYASRGEFLAGTVPFIREGVAAGEAVLVVETAETIAMLRGALGDASAAVMFADMAAVGKNPALIIPAWRAFVDREGADGKGLRGIGEPIWAERTEEQLIECQRHESLLNVAFAGGRPWQLLCPYDTSRLGTAVIDEARRSHEYVTQSGGSTVSAEFRGVDASAAPFDAQLAEPARPGRTATFDREGLLDLRRKVARFATSAGLGAGRATELVTAVNEVATNSLQHGGGDGTLRMWRSERAVVCEIRDAGIYRRALGDRERPGERPGDPRGLWLANQLCDLVQIRTLSEGTVVRLHVELERE